MSEQTTGSPADIRDALQGFLDQTPRNEQGVGPQLAGYAAAVVYVRPDGSTGLTVVAPYESAEQVAELLDNAHELVVTAEPDSE